MSEQRLNSLERFRKRPGRLVLEERGHCEVPAGCGGVVLRWRNPLAVLPVTIHLYAPVQPACLIDGQPLPSARPDLAPGPHVVGILLEDVDLSEELLMFVADHGEKDAQRDLPAEVVERPFRVVSTGDGTWKYTLDRPPDDWAALSFDDHAWAALVQVPVPQLERGDPGAYQSQRCAELGAACLGLSSEPAEGLSAIWIRKAFEVPPPERRDPQA
jgi:hypothetical protein